MEAIYAGSPAADRAAGAEGDTRASGAEAA